MQVEEGNGLSNEIEYSYTLSKHEWYATYEFRVHYSLLDDNGGKVETKTFEVDGQKWSVVLSCTKNEELIAGLVPRDRSRRKVSFTFTLVNHDDTDKDVTRVAYGDFRIPYRGIKAAPIPKSLVFHQDPPSSFLRDNFLTMRLEMRVRGRESEQWKVVVDETATTVCNWRIRYLRELSPRVVQSSVFAVGNCRMRMILIHDVSPVASGGMSVLLESVSHPYCCFTGELLITNHRSREDNLVTSLDPWISEYFDEASGRSSVKVLDCWESLDEASGFANDGWMSLSIKLTQRNPKKLAQNVLHMWKQTTTERTSKKDAASLWTTKEGTGCSSGIPYAYTLNTTEWFASYSWCVHRSLLDRSGVGVITKTFYANGRKWQVGVRKAEDESIEAYLVSKESTPVTAHVGVALANFRNDVHFIHPSDCAIFESPGRPWVHKILFSDRIKEPGSNLMKGGFFIVFMDMRLKVPKNEICDISITRNVAACQWRLKPLSETKLNFVSTPRFIIGDIEMEIGLYHCEVRGHSWVLLHNLSNTPIRAKCEARAKNRDHSNNRVTDVVGSLFPDDWKETRVFLTTAELEREDMGFVKDGWMDLLIRVAVLGTEGTNPVTTSHVADPYVIRPQRRVLDPEPGTLMRVREGAGSCKDIQYSYTLNKHKYYAVYECRVHRSLLNSTAKVIWTAPFELDYRQWRIGMRREVNGHLTACVKNVDVTRLTAHICLTLVNHRDDKKSRCKGALASFFPAAFNDTHHFQLCHAEDAKDVSLGCLKDDFFLVRAEIRLKLPKNEHWTVSVKRKTATCEWRLRDVVALCPQLLTSQTFRIGTTAWSLVLYQKGTESCSEDFALCIYNEKARALRTRCALRLVSNESPKKDKVKVLKETIKAKENRLLCDLFKSEELSEKSCQFVEDGWITLVAEITLLDEEMVPQCTSCKDRPLCSVRHGNTKHLCYCLDCAKKAREAIDDHQELKCPVCQEVVERVAMEHGPYLPRCPTCEINPTCAVQHKNTTHLCYCTPCGEKLAQRLRSGSAQHCPFCMEPVEGVIMNAAPWKTAAEREKIAQCHYCKADVPTCAAFRRDPHGKRFRASLGTQCSAGKHTCLCRECARRQLHEILTENQKIERPARAQPAGQILIIDAPEELMTRGRRRSQSDAQ